MKAKDEAMKLWEKDPCGSRTSNNKFGTKEFFEDIENYKYVRYAPWMLKVIGFGKYKGKKILEVGCGLSTDLSQFAKNNCDVIGTDLTLNSLLLSKKRFQIYNLKGNFMRVDAEYLPFRDSIFDIVYSFGVLHHTPNTKKAIENIYKVLKPGGEAIIMLYNKNSFNYWYNIIFRHGIVNRELRNYSIRELLSKYIEYSSNGVEPLVKVYNKSEVKELFKQFGKTAIEIHQLRNDELPVIGNYLPKSIVNGLSHICGWFTIIKAIKGE